METTPDFKTFDEFLNFYKEENIQTFLAKNTGLEAQEKFQELKDKYYYATIEEEKEEALETCIEEIKKVKVDLILHYQKKELFRDEPLLLKLVINFYFQHLELYHEINKTQIDYQIENHLVNPYPQVFNDYLSFKLFERLYEDYKDSTTPLANFSFIYWQMYEEGFISEYFKSEMFRLWLSKEPFKIVVDRIKTKDNCNTRNKMNHYNTIKEIIYSEYKTV